MRRELTNKIRYIMDECLPPLIRDSKWFMWPFFVLAYKTWDVKRFMNFKARAHTMSAEDYSIFYKNLGQSVSRSRTTDLNEKSIDFIIDYLDDKGLTLLDVGSGNGYLLSRLAQKKKWARICGVDVAQPLDANKKNIELHTGLLPNLPFEDKEFDVVTCTHVIEHVLDVEGSIRELLRITKRQLFLILPRQRYYFYTLDEHLNFYPEIEPLTKFLKNHDYHVSMQDGDWAISVNIKK